MNGGPSTATVSRPKPRRILLDAPSWLALRQVMPGVPVPVGIEPRWDDGIAQGQQEETRAAAVQRLMEAGVLRSSPRVDLPATNVVNPVVASALLLLAVAPVRVSLRSWAQGKAIQASLGLTGDRGVGLARLQPVNRAANGEPVLATDRVGIEFSAFLVEHAVAEVMRLLPPGADEGAVDEVSATSPRPVAVGWEQSIDWATALDEGRDDVLAALLADEGLAEVPQLFEDVALRRAGAVEVVVAVGGGGPEWRGLWLMTGTATVTVLPYRDTDGATKVRLATSGPGAVRRAVLDALTSAYDTVAAAPRGQRKDG